MSFKETLQFEKDKVEKFKFHLSKENDRYKLCWCWKYIGNIQTFLGVKLTSSNFLVIKIMVIKTTYFIRLPILNRYINIKSYGEAKYMTIYQKKNIVEKGVKLKTLLKKIFTLNQFTMINLKTKKKSYKDKLIQISMIMDNHQIQLHA